jgi:hypothetical protein
MTERQWLAPHTDAVRRTNVPSGQGWPRRDVQREVRFNSMPVLERRGTMRASSSRGSRHDNRQTSDELSMVDNNVTTDIPAHETSEAPGITFADLGLGAEMLASVEAMGYEEPTPIQVKTVPVMMTGSDVIAQAHRLRQDGCFRSPDH